MNTTRLTVKRFASAIVAVALTAAASSTMAQLAQEPPPPPVESGLRPESRLIEPRVEDLVRQMSELLAGAESFALEAEEVFDDVPEHRPRAQLMNRRYVALKRPNRLAGDASGDALNRSFWYDGETLSVLDKEHNAFSTSPVPATIDGALDAIFDRTGMVVPLGDFLYADVYGRMMGSVQRGVYLGIHEVVGLACHHLSFEQETIDWQLWIDAGEQPLPRKLVIAYKTEDEVPQYAVIIKEWNLKAEVPEDVFRFDPPEGAERVELTQVLEPDSEEEKKP